MNGKKIYKIVDAVAKRLSWLLFVLMIAPVFISMSLWLAQWWTDAPERTAIYLPNFSFEKENFISLTFAAVCIFRFVIDEIAVRVGWEKRWDERVAQAEKDDMADPL